MIDHQRGSRSVLQHTTTSIISQNPCKQDLTCYAAAFWLAPTEAVRGVSAGGAEGSSPSSFHACWLYFAPDAMRYLNAGNASSPVMHTKACKFSQRLCWYNNSALMENHGMPPFQDPASHSQGWLQPTLDSVPVEAMSVYLAERCRNKRKQDEDSGCVPPVLTKAVRKFRATIVSSSKAGSQYRWLRICWW